jgi:hypothetical protein
MRHYETSPRLPGMILTENVSWLCADKGGAVDVPVDLTGLVLFIVLLWPGFAYNGVRARRRPDRQLTSLQETVTIASASLTALTVTGLLFGLIRVLLPGETPDIHRLIFSSHSYLADHYVLTGWWAAAFLAVAVLGSFGAAEALSSEQLGRVRFLKRLAVPPDPSTMSAWWLAFTYRGSEKVDIYVGCAVDDGSYVSGRLRSFSQVAEDSEDRDLVLRAPISVRPPGGARAEVIDGAALMAISARHIVTTTVTYVRRPPAPATPLAAAQQQGSPAVTTAAAGDPSCS